jgi:hypothetical protein
VSIADSADFGNDRIVNHRNHSPDNFSGVQMIGG